MGSLLPNITIIIVEENKGDEHHLSLYKSSSTLRPAVIKSRVLLSVDGKVRYRGARPIAHGGWWQRPLATLRPRTPHLRVRDQNQLIKH